MPRWSRLPIGLSIVGLALVLRLYNLDGPSLWADEANSLGRARLPLGELFPTLATADTHPPLYYLLLRGWISLAGTSEAAVRGFSVACGIAAVPLAALAARGLAGRAAAWVAALLAATAPVLVIFAQEGRSYTLLALFGLGSFLLLRRALAVDSRGAWAAYALCTAGSLYTHNLAFLWLAWQVVIVLADGPRALLTHRLRRFALAQGAAYLLYLPWASSIAGQFRDFSEGGGWIGTTEPARLLFTVASFLGGASYHREGDLSPTLGLSQPYLLVAPLLLAYVGARRLPSRDRWCLLAFVALPVATLFLVGLRLPVYVDRALVPTALGMVLLMAAAFRPPLALLDRAVLGAALAMTLVLSGLGVATYVQQPRDDYRGLARDLAAATHPGESVLFLPGFGQVAFRYYWEQAPGPARLVDLDGRPAISDEELWQLADGGNALWVVRVAAPPPPAGNALGDRLQQMGLAPVGRRDYPDPLLTLEFFTRDSRDRRGLAWSPRLAG